MLRTDLLHAKDVLHFWVANPPCCDCVSERPFITLLLCSIHPLREGAISGRNLRAKTEWVACVCDFGVRRYAFVCTRTFLRQTLPFFFFLCKSKGCVSEKLLPSTPLCSLFPHATETQKRHTQGQFWRNDLEEYILKTSWQDGKKSTYGSAGICQQNLQVLHCGHKSLLLYPNT